MKLKNLILLLVLSSKNFAHADAVSLELLFAEKYVGVQSCLDATSEYYCATEVATYNTAGILEKKKSKIEFACFTGGGDCSAYALFTEIKPLAGDDTLARTKAKTGEYVWIKVKKTNIEDFKPPNLEQVVFRSDLKFIFLDTALSKKISVNEIYDIPQGQKFNSAIEHIGVREIPADIINGQKIIGLVIEAIETDLSESELTSPKENGYKRFIKKVYFPATDSKGRINYWYTTQYGC